MSELLVKLLKTGKKDALSSIDELTNAAAALGYSAREIEEAIEELGSISLSDDVLSAVTGGTTNEYFTSGNEEVGAHLYTNDEYNIVNATFANNSANDGNNGTYNNNYANNDIHNSVFVNNTFNK